MPDMDSATHNDAELAERIARGDWGVDVEPPAIHDIMRAVAQRQRRRRTAIGATAAAGLAAAVVTAAVVLTPDHRTAQTPATQTPTVSAPTTSLAPQVANCSNSRLLLSSGRYGGTPERRTQMAFVENIGSRPCSLPHLPTLSVGTKSGWARRVDAGSFAAGPWNLPPKKALIMTVTAARSSACSSRVGGQPARRFIIQLDGNTYTFRFPGMRIDGCRGVALTDLRIAAPPRR